MITRARLALVVALTMAACTASPRQRPLDLGDVETGPGSLEAIRRQLRGTWDLVALESSPEPGVPRVPIKATGVLVYDEYANLTIDAHTDDPAAPPAARESRLLRFTGRATIDPVRHELQLMDMKGNVNPAEVLAPERRRRFEVDVDTLRLSSFEEDGQVTAISTWQRRK